MTLGSKNHERKVHRKQKRLQHLIANDSNVICCDTPTRVMNYRKIGLLQFVIAKYHRSSPFIQFVEFSDLQCWACNRSGSNSTGD